MSRKPDGFKPKCRVQISIDADLYEWLRDAQGGAVTNFSQWVENDMRQEKLKKAPLKQCPCGVCANGFNWVKWGLKCPECNHDHSQIDKRREIQERVA